MKEKIGFVGLGTMGKPMASNLLKAGFPVTVFNRTISKTQTLINADAKVALSAAELAATCDVILLMLSDDCAVKNVVLSEKGILTSANPGLIVIDSSTVSPGTSKDLALALSSRGAFYLDAPVTGSRKQAEEGSLTFLIGGEKKIFEKCQSIFAAMGKKTFYLGENGMGACAKLGNNMMGAIHLAALCEAMTLVKKYGVDPSTFFEIISQSGAKSAVVDGKGPKILKGDFKPDFALSLMYKDLKLVEQLGEELNLPTPVLNSTREVFLMATQNLKEDGDMCSLYQWYQTWLNQKTQ